MTVRYSITGVNEDEYVAITDLWEASVKASHHFLTAEDIAYFKPLVLKDFLPQVRLFAIRNEQKTILGFLGLSEDKIEMLFISPDSFGLGLGKTLLDFAVNVHGIHLVDVNEQNPAATRFYKRLGFSVQSRSATDPLGKPFPILHMKYSPE